LAVRSAILATAWLLVHNRAVKNQHLLTLCLFDYQIIIVIIENENDLSDTI